MEDVTAYTGRFKCLDEPEKLVLRGNYDSQIASNLMVVFDKCNNATSKVTCKSEEEIHDYMKYKYLMSVVNTRRFMQDKNGDSQVTELSTRHWYPFDPDERTDYVEHLKRTVIQNS